LAAPAPRSVAEVLERMRAVEAALPHGDGVACFTRLYRAVTETVEAELARARFRDERFTTALDLAFANLFFAALRQGGVPHAWAPLMEARSRRGVHPLQFALAGMNAHINRDLPIALVDTWRRLRLEPNRRGPQHADFLTMNRLLAATEERVKGEFLTGLAGEVDRDLGRLDDVLAMWNVERARDAAWTNGETLWTLRAVPPLRTRFLAALDRMVGFAARGILRPLV
jgi:uncharacterized protein DUF5995